MRNQFKLGVKGRLALALAAFVPAAAMANPLAIDATVDATPATVPVPNPLNAVTPANGKILILPFQPVNPNDPAAWLGKSIQESMAADLTVAAPDRVLVSDQAAPTLEAAIAMGKQRGARYVVAGGFVNIDRELRITGQVVDVETGKPVTGLKATGQPSTVFQLEDTLARQVRAQVFGEPTAPAAPPDAPPVMTPIPPEKLQPPTAPAAQPEVITPTPDSTGVRTDYNAPARYSSYAVAPSTPVYGASYNNYYYYPTYDSGYGGYAYYYPDYYPTYYSPYCGFYPAFGCSPFSLSFCFGGGFCSRFHFDHARFFDRGRGSAHFNNGRFGSGVSFVGNFNSRGISSRGSFAARSPAVVRGSVGTLSRNSFAGVRSFNSGPTRSPAFYSRGSISASRGNSFGGGFHSSFGGGGMSHSFGGGGGMSHGSGGGHGGGGHR